MAAIVYLLAEFTAQPALILRSSLDGVEARKMDNVRPDGRRGWSTHDADSHHLLQVFRSSEQRLTSHQFTQYTPARRHLISSIFWV